MDAFYSSVEENRNPGLRGAAVVVGSRSGRGVVMTANYEARKYGIRSGMPLALAYRKNPAAIFLAPDMALYWEVSQRIMQIVRSHAERVQQSSVDEAFFSCGVRTYDEAETLAKEIKKEISEKEHLTCSIGIGPNKLIAKMASDFQKPDGLTVVTKEGARKFLEPLPIRKLYGVGPKTESVLNAIGVEKIGDINKAKKEDIVELFGKWGHQLYDSTQGIGDTEIIEDSEPKSIGRETTFDEDTRDNDVLKKTISEMADDVYAEAHSGGYSFSTVVLKIRFTGFETHTKQKSFKQQSVTKDMVKRAGEELLALSIGKKKIRLIGLRVTNLSVRK